MQENVIAEAATKNRRGRPQTPHGKVTRSYRAMGTENETIRADANLLYAMAFIDFYDRTPGSFFVKENKHIRRQGIAEQLGRIYDAEIATDAELLELTQHCIDEYNSGVSVKEIEKHLRELRLIFMQAQTEP